MKKVLIFDFDGTMVDSDTLKRRIAWHTIFPENEVRREVLTDVLARIKETRFDILRELHRVLGGDESEREDFVERNAERYNQTVQEGIERLGLMPGVSEALKELSQFSRLYINTATPEYGIRETVKRLQIEKFFVDVLGKPTSKEGNIRAILSRERINPDEAVVIGNGLDDLRAAQTTGVLFIGLRDQFNNWDGTAFSVVSDWFELRERLKCLIVTESV